MANMHRAQRTGRTMSNNSRSAHFVPGMSPDIECPGYGG
jgi:hypothetical protein